MTFTLPERTLVIATHREYDTDVFIIVLMSWWYNFRPELYMQMRLIIQALLFVY